MVEKTRSVEYYRLWDDHTWDTDFIDIPENTPDNLLEEAVRAAAGAIDWLEEAPVSCGVYWLPDMDELELEVELED